MFTQEASDYLKTLKKKKHDELEVVMYMKPTSVEYADTTVDDIKNYFNWSERGEKVDDIDYGRTGLHALVHGKRAIKIHANMYEQSILEGTMYYYEFSEFPPNVALALGKEMFGGKALPAINQALLNK